MDNAIERNKGSDQAGPRLEEVQLATSFLHGIFDKTAEILGIKDVDLAPEESVLQELPRKDRSEASLFIRYLNEFVRTNNSRNGCSNEINPAKRLQALKAFENKVLFKVLSSVEGAAGERLKTTVAEVCTNLGMTKDDVCILDTLGLKFSAELASTCRSLLPDRGESGHLKVKRQPYTPA